MRIEGEKIYLAPFTKEHAKNWVLWTHDEDVTRYSVMRMYTMKEELKFCEEREKESDPDECFCIFIKESDKLIGTCGLHRKNKDRDYDNEFSVGLVIGEKDEWGKGYGTDAMKTLLKYTKDTYGPRPIYLTVDIPNIPAQKVYKKCGFEIVKKREDEKRINSGGEHYLMRIELT